MGAADRLGGGNRAEQPAARCSRSTGPSVSIRSGPPRRAWPPSPWVASSCCPVRPGLLGETWVVIGSIVLGCLLYAGGPVSRCGGCSSSMTWPGRSGERSRRGDGGTRRTTAAPAPGHAPPAPVLPVSCTNGTGTAAPEARPAVPVAAPTSIHPSTPTPAGSRRSRRSSERWAASWTSTTPTTRGSTSFRPRPTGTSSTAAPLCCCRGRAPTPSTSSPVSTTT